MRSFYILVGVAVSANWQHICQKTASQAQTLAIPIIVTLDQSAQSELRFSDSKRPRGGAYATLESVADHACATAYGPFFDFASAGAFQSLIYMLSSNMLPVDIIKCTVIGFTHDRRVPSSVPALIYHPSDQTISDYPDTMCIRDSYWPI
jgi:hypothetical protein